MPEPGRVVLKFGGTSVSTLASWETIAEVVEARRSEGERPVVVHSALAGVTDLLEEAVARALEGAHEPVLSEIRHRHDRLADAMGLALPPQLTDRFNDLRRLVQGVALVGDASPATRARVLAHGALMATILGAEYLQSRGLSCRWVDAREVLTSAQAPEGGGGGPLSADCTPGPDPALRASWAEESGVIVTQGRIARSPRGETVWLGRGGTDASAAYIASRLDAVRLEVWGRIPGMFSADPRSVPSARLLKSLSYDEAQEIAITGSRVLHPRAIPAIRAQGIPIHIRSTASPDLQGTVITAVQAEGPGRVKAISRKKGVTLVSMESLAMWQQVGFLARAFDVFRRWGLSVDLVSTSESMVTVSLDRVANVLTEEVLGGLATDLGELCEVSLVTDAAALSLVGRHIRGMLYRLGPVLELFREEKIHLVTQAASDLNLTFVVDEEQADRLVARLHRLLIQPGEQDPVFGPTWEALTAAPSTPAPPARWWQRKRERLLEVMESTDAAYVYDLDVVRRQAAALGSLRAVDRVLYSVKANPHPAILETVRDAGLGFECVSAAEIRHLESVFGDLDPEEVLFTPNFAPRDEYAYALERGVRVTLDALHPLRHWAEMFRGREVLLRVDPGRGEGHHEKVRTAGGGSKFGLIPADLDEAGDRVAAAGGTVVGLHVHSGSGILDSDHWRRTGAFLTKLLPRFPDVRVLDLGGGLGVPDTPAESGLDLRTLDAALDDLASAAPDVELWLEPGRFVVAEAGVLLARVTQVKEKEQVRYVGLATGMNTFIRPALYGAYHEIQNLTRLGEPSTQVVTVVGPICETGDRFGTDRLLPEALEGDVLVVANTGAYGRSMSSHYNMRDPAEERVLR